MKSININEIKKIDKPYIIDVRTKEEYDNYNIPGTNNVVLEELLTNPQKYLEKEKEAYIMCAAGARSLLAVAQLSKQEYKVINLDKGINGYIK